MGHPALRLADGRSRPRFSPPWAGVDCGGLARSSAQAFLFLVPPGGSSAGPACSLVGESGHSSSPGSASVHCAILVGVAPSVQRRGLAADSEGLPQEPLLALRAGPPSRPTSSCTSSRAAGVPAGQGFSQGTCLAWWVRMQIADLSFFLISTGAQDETVLADRGEGMGEISN